MLRKSSLEHAFDTKYVQNCYCEGKCSGNLYFKMHLTPHMYKIVTLKANAKNSSLEHAFGTKYVQNHYSKGKY